MSNKITTVIFDWAGTTVDFGCFAPVEAFIKAFEKYGITPTMDETRKPMGLAKREHIRVMLSENRLANLWREIYAREFTEADIDAIYQYFEPELFSSLDKHTEVIPGTLQAVAELRDMNIKIGSTTGYNRVMMDIVVSAAKEYGYAPDTMVCPSDTNGVGRPAPFMLWRNLELLGAASIGEVIKVGDTAADILEGKNAGCLSVGVIAGSSMLGLSLLDYLALPSDKRDVLFEATRNRYISCGADHVLNEIADLPELIAHLNSATGKQKG
jgi:phosphonoacetaldehyde hydrolase